MTLSPLTLAALQPAAPSAPDHHGAMMDSAWRLAAAAVQQGAHLLVLPEYFNVLGLPTEVLPERARTADEVLARGRDHCLQTGTWLLLPLVEQRGSQRFNCAHLISPSGDIILTYDKTHLTLVERRDLGLTPGQAVPVVETPLGRVGVMICYDVYFPEVARLLSLQDADLILFPSLQRSDTPERCMLLNRARAVDSTCHLVRASYGLPDGDDYAPGKVYGGSCVIAPDGTVLADAGQHEGLAPATVDLQTPWSRARCSGAPAEPVRDFLRADRRPELYGPLAAVEKEPAARRGS